MRKALGRMKAILLTVVCLMTLTVFSVACTLSTYAEGTPVRNATSGVAYETLKAAIDAAEEGNTIELTGDIEVAESISIGRNLSLNLNGHTITSKVNSDSMIRVPSGKILAVDVKNSDLDGKVKSFLK